MFRKYAHGIGKANGRAPPPSARSCSPWMPWVIVVRNVWNVTFGALKKPWVAPRRFADIERTTPTRGAAGPAGSVRPPPKYAAAFTFPVTGSRDGLVWQSEHAAAALMMYEPLPNSASSVGSVG